MFTSYSLFLILLCPCVVLLQLPLRPVFFIKPVVFSHQILKNCCYRQTPLKWKRSRKCWPGQQQRASWVESLFRHQKTVKRGNAGRIIQVQSPANIYPQEAKRCRQEMSLAVDKQRQLKSKRMGKVNVVRMIKRKIREEREGKRGEG